MNQATAAFIQENADGDVRQLALRGTKDPEVDLAFALDQIAGRQTARKKLPSWAAVEGVVYPPHLSMEQCSSEQTAIYKCGIMEQVPQEAHILLRYLENVSAEIFPDVTLPMDSFRSQVTHVALS